MICNYQNINDYCNNKFAYQYTSTPISSSGDMVTSVIRTDKDTGEKITISSDTNLFVEPCDNNDILEVISYWECYKIYVSNNNLVLQPSLETLNANQKNNVFSNYDNNIQDGVTIKIDNSNTIVINSSIENQIHLGNIICLANILYAKNSNSVMPYILDINNAAYYLNYATLKQVLGEYFKKTAQTKRAKDDLIHQLKTVKGSDDTANKYYCDNKVSSNIIQVNKFIDYENYKEVSLILPEICDPPCDPSSCQICISGTCVTLTCDENQHCCNAICKYAVTSQSLGGTVTLPVGTASCSALGPSWSYAGMCEAAPPAFGMPEMECVCCCPSGYTTLNAIDCPCLCVANE